MTLLKLSRGGLYPVLEESFEETSIEDWRRNPQDHAEATALAIKNDTSIADVAADLNGFSVIILDFPTFTDGRAYSQARLLRERYGYTGQIRARGEILQDQLFFMIRCGFDAFEFAGDDVDHVKNKAQEFSFAYQSAADRAEPVWRRRLSRARAA